MLGSTRVEPLDFWWAPLNIWMITAYAVIVGGGLLITRRLRLLGLAATFWLALAVGIGILAASGHCMTTNWAFAPVCGVDFWRVIVTSPEVLIFLFFMITDPKTVPAGRVGRVVFGVLVAVMSTLLMAPQTNEFGTKVGLLAGLVVVCAARPVLDRLLPEPRSAADDLGRFAARLAAGGSAGPAVLRGPARVGLVVAAVLVLGVGIVAAGTPARGLVVPDTSEMLDGVPHQVDPATFPEISVGQDVADWDHTIEGPGAQQILMTLAENLELENQALLRRDASILTAVDHGDRLDGDAGPARPGRGDRDDRRRSLPVRLGEREPHRAVRGPDRREPRLRRPGAPSPRRPTTPPARCQDRRSSPFAQTFALRRATGSRWLNVGVLPAGAGG